MSAQKDDDGGITIDEGSTDIQYIKESSVSKVNIGDSYTYTLYVTNGPLGVIDAKNVKLSDTLAPEITYIASTVRVNGADPAAYGVSYTYNAITQKLDFTLSSVPIGTTIAISFPTWENVIITDTLPKEVSGTITNASLTTPGGTSPVTDIDTGVQVSKGTPKPSVTKTNNVGGSFGHDEVMEYTIIVKNDTSATGAWKDVVLSDAPALKIANVGVAMGSMGSDIAVDAADIALMGDDISKIPYLKRLSNATVGTIRFGIGLSIAINFVAIILSVLGVLTPTTGALVHNGGSILVVLIAALLYDRKFI